MSSLKPDPVYRQLTAFDAFDAGRNAVHQRELQALFRTRTRDEWTTFFLANDLPCAPVNRSPDSALSVLGPPCSAVEPRKHLDLNRSTYYSD